MERNDISANVHYYPEHLSKYNTHMWLAAYILRRAVIGLRAGETGIHLLEAC